MLLIIAMTAVAVGIKLFLITHHIHTHTHTHTHTGIQTLQEANMAFLPYESKVFTLDYPQGFSDFYSQVSIGQSEMYQRIADQLATVCAMLGEYPAVRYRK